MAYSVDRSGSPTILSRMYNVPSSSFLCNKNGVPPPPLPFWWGWFFDFFRLWLRGGFIGTRKMEHKIRGPNGSTITLFSGPGTCSSIHSHNEGTENLEKCVTRNHNNALVIVLAYSICHSVHYC